MQYMYIVMVKCAFNDRYRNIATSFPSVVRILLSTLRKLIEASVQLFSLVVKCLYNLLPFWRSTVVLLSSKKGRGLWFLQVPLSNYPRIGGSTSCIISVIWSPLSLLILLWTFNAILSWNFSLILFIYGSPLSVFCGHRACIVSWSSPRSYTRWHPSFFHRRAIEKLNWMNSFVHQ